MPDTAAPARAAEFRLTDGDFRRIADRVRAAFGIQLGDHKRQMVYARLSRRLRALGLSSFRAYLDHLDTPAGADEHEHFTNAVTTNLTAFFREGHHFAHFERALSDPAGFAGRRLLRVWSAGCSTGEEAYSIAMAAHGQAAALAAAGREVDILATDLDTRVLAAARTGRYPLDRLAPVPPRFRGPTFFVAARGAVAVAGPVRRRVRFRQLNLAAPWQMRPSFDAIFCRNVLIYFDPATKALVLDRLARTLAPGGILYLGHSESLLGAHPLLVGEGQTVYRRTAR